MQTHTMSITPSCSCAIPTSTLSCHRCNTQQHVSDGWDESAATGEEEEEGRDLKKAEEWWERSCTAQWIQWKRLHVNFSSQVSLMRRWVSERNKGFSREELKVLLRWKKWHCYKNLTVTKSSNVSFDTSAFVQRESAAHACCILSHIAL